MRWSNGRCSRAASSFWPSSFCARTRSGVDCPAEFRPDRPDDELMVFGHGRHTCPGAPIARAQMGAISTALLSRKDLHRATPGARLRFSGFWLRSLEVEFDSAEAD